MDWDNQRLISSQFYPPDVPSEWYLTYYANLITACVLSPQKWQMADEQQIQQWLTDTQENFWFYLLCESADDVVQATQKMTEFKTKFAGLVLAASVDLDMNIPSVDILVMGREVFNYDATSLRQAKPALMQWLASEACSQHALILVSADQAHQVQEVQTLLELLGNSW